MENPEGVGQKRQRVLTFLADHAELFCRQGSVHPSWRRNQGKQLGPFFRLVYRVGRKQHMVYLGTDPRLVEEVRTRLLEMQAPLRQERAFDRRIAQIEENFKKSKQEFALEVQRQGLHLKGKEIRGWRSWRRFSSSDQGTTQPKGKP